MHVDPSHDAFPAATSTKRNMHQRAARLSCSLSRPSPSQSALKQATSKLRHSATSTPSTRHSRLQTPAGPPSHAAEDESVFCGGAMDCSDVSGIPSQDHHLWE